MNNEEFYIGWMPAAPTRLARKLFKWSAVIISLVILVSASLALLQRPFSTASFEFGQTVSLTGVYHDWPVPSLRIESSGDFSGQQAAITVPLVGYGKSGARSIIDQLEKDSLVRLNGRTLTLRGSLLYSDGKTILQIDRYDHPLTRIGSMQANSGQQIDTLGMLTLEGEILDPKCYFGVMKPGSGKPHRDCAIRCIAGGISPVLWIQDPNGVSNYCLLVGTDGKTLNQPLQQLIAEPVRLKARALRIDDWIVLTVEDPASIERTGRLSWFKTRDGLAECKPALH